MADEQIAQGKNGRGGTMADQANAQGAQLDAPRCYQIWLQGELDEQWAAWFDGLTVTHTTNGDTLLTGLVTDQAALYGLLRKVRDLGLPLLACICLDTDWPTLAEKN